jgi:hypothetical protein
MLIVVERRGDQLGRRFTMRGDGQHEAESTLRASPLRE